MAWGLFGTTNVGNLVLLCARHHGVLHRKGWKAVLHANADFEVWSPNGQHWITEPPGRIQGRMPVPGADQVAGDSPLQQHRQQFEAAYGALQRVRRLQAEARARPYGQAIANLIGLPARRDWWNIKTACTEPLVPWQDTPEPPRLAPLTKPFTRTPTWQR